MIQPKCKCPVQFKIEMPPETKERLKRMARHYNHSMTSLVLQLIETELEEFEQEMEK